MRFEATTGKLMLTCCDSFGWMNGCEGEIACMMFAICYGRGAYQLSCRLNMCSVVMHLWSSGYDVSLTR